MKAIIEFRNISFAYRKNETEYESLLLDSINFSIEEHSLAFIIGESGVGKTSLLRMVNGLESPLSGSIYFHGKDLKMFDPCRLRRKISLLQQIPVMFPLTVEENLNLSPEAEKIPLQEKRDILKSLGLNENILSKTATELSIGEAQRVALTRCLMNRPEVMLLDEPTASLDQKNKMRLFENISQYITESRITVLWVTHDPSLIKECSFKKFQLKDKKLYTITP